jgi:hypothetical protein
MLTMLVRGYQGNRLNTPNALAEVGALVARRRLFKSGHSTTASHRAWRASPALILRLAVRAGGS